MHATPGVPSKSWAGRMVERHRTGPHRICARRHSSHLVSSTTPNAGQGTRSRPSNGSVHRWGSDRFERAILVIDPRPTRTLLRLNLPATTPSKPAQLQALVAAHDRDARLQMRVTKVESDNKAGQIVIAPKPTIVEPREGATYPPQTPLRVRIVPAKDAKDTTYRIEIQVQANFDWRDVTTVATPAGLAQSPQGYRGWGGKPGVPVTAITAIAGTYRMRARGSAPQMGQPGDWVEFKIDGRPGPQVDVMDQAKPAPGKAGDAAQSAAWRVGGQPSTLNALGTSPAVAVPNKAGAASLNPQPLPPKTSPAALTATPLDAARNKAGAVLLNPQPLPPKTAPGSLTATPLPGGLPQAPSSLR